ncbi:hypothetical protein D3874_06285 [Oleomonas cavernae]|uniref:Uncharacterized protein n=1 Tax=Oleomonas cavernae TaxID=2320859 RepID=A0A418W9I4_9PROT|nr:hypothetical protein [Oleomonas cavernae]RJF86677.1 hypothetical protein D3874_06285 [Oleomonas cavernae]
MIRESSTAATSPATGDSLAALTQALADLTAGADTGGAMIAAIREVVPRLSLPPARRSLIRRLWGRVPGEQAGPDDAVVAMTGRLRDLIAHAEGRAATIDWIADQAKALAVANGGEESVRLQLLAAAQAALRAEHAAAAWGRHFVETTLPLWRATQNTVARHAILTAALKPEDQ